MTKATVSIEATMAEMTDEILFATLEVAWFTRLPRGSAERREAFQTFMAASKELNRRGY